MPADAPQSHGKNAALRALEGQERAFDLWQQQVLGYPVWPLLRLSRYRDALLAGDAVIRPTKAEAPGLPPGLASRLRKLTGPVTQLARAAAASAASAASATAADGRDIWLLTSSTYRRRDPAAAGSQGAKEDAPHDELPCVFASHLQAQLGPRLRVLEVGTSGDARLAARPEILHLDPYVGLVQAAAAMAERGSRGLVADESRRAFAPTSAAELARRAVYGHGMQAVGKALIARLRPKAVFVLCAYGSMIPLQRAVRAAGIPLIELQHGVIHESHPGYVFDRHLTRDHRPDHLVVFGEHFGQLIDRVSPGFDARWSVGGHPWLRRARAQAGAAAGPQPRAQPVVVFGQYDPPVQALLTTLVPALRGLLPAEIPLIYKPHPREPMDTLGPHLGAAGVTLAGHTDDTYALLARCRASITVYSTVAIEALAFACQSLVVRSPFWSDDITSLVAEGMLTPVSDAADIARAVQSEPPSRATGSQREKRADSLFGLSAPEPDFEALIAHLTARKRQQRCP